MLNLINFFFQISSYGTMKKQEKGEKDEVGVVVPSTPGVMTSKSTGDTTTKPKASLSISATSSKSTPVTPTMGMKQSKSDHSGLAGRTSKGNGTVNKKYISKSQENLSGPKKKLTTVKENEPTLKDNDMVSSPTTSLISVAKAASENRVSSAHPLEKGNLVSPIRASSASIVDRNKENQVGGENYLTYHLSNLSYSKTIN